MSVKQSHRSSSGSLRGLGGGSSSVNRVSTVHSSGSYRSPGSHGGLGSRVSYGAGGFGSSGGSVSLGLGSAGSYGSGFSYGGGSGGGFGSGFGFGGGHSGVSVSGGENILNINEKETMQLLNDRLATYINQVHSLEKVNAQMERNIREWYDKQQPYTSPDFQAFFKTIEDLQTKIMQGNANNANIMLQIDNARLAADDFRNKCETETAIRMGVEADTTGLRRVLDELTMTKKDLEMQIQTMNEDLQNLKKNHEEEVNSLRSQMGAKINVEVDAAPAVDLNKVLTEIRAQYETIIDTNEKEAEKWFIEKSDDLNQQMTCSSQQLQTCSTEILQLTHTTQNLEIDLQTQSSMKAALENSLAETEGRYCSQLAQLQDMISDVEMRLAELRSDLERQNFEYKILLDAKIRLEKEIGTYRQLIEGEDTHYSSWNSRAGRDMSTGGTVSSGSISSSGSSGGIGGMTHSSSGKPNVLVEDVREGYHQSK